MREEARQVERGRHGKGQERALQHRVSTTHFNMHKSYVELELLYPLQEHFGDSGSRKRDGSQFAL